MKKKGGSKKMKIYLAPRLYWTSLAVLAIVYK